MKTFRIIGLIAILCFIMPAFVSCEKDDDEPKGDKPESVDAILGTYSGSLAYSVMGFQPGAIEGTYDLKIIKDANDAEEVSVVLPECSFTPPIPESSSFTIPSLTIHDVDVTVNGNVYNLSENDLSIEFEGTTYMGKLTGKIEGKNANIKFTLRPGRMPMDINFTFTGTLK